MTLTVRFMDFPKAFNPFNNYILRLLTAVAGKDVLVLQDSKTIVDLEFSSNFIQDSHFNRMRSRLAAEFNPSAMTKYEEKWVWGFRTRFSSKARKRIWCSGENLRPPLEYFDGTMSFNPTDRLLNNVFFPYWMHRINWFDDSGYFEISPRPYELVVDRHPIQRELNICTFSSKFEPGRERIIKALPSQLDFQGFGIQYSKPVESKLATSSKFGLQLCSENDLYPNYVTEKLIEAWYARCVPVWAGLDHKGFFNVEAFIDVTSLSTLEILSRLEEITIDELMHIQSQPILRQTPDLTEVLNFLNHYI